MFFHYGALLFIRWVPKQDTRIYINFTATFFLATRGSESTTVQGQIHSGHWRPHSAACPHGWAFVSLWKEAKSFFQS